MKISFRKSLKLIALLITSLLIATVSATAYVTLQWTITATVAANPYVCFFAWSAPTTKLNTFDYAVNIFPSVKTVDENITHGVWNWNATEPRTIYFRLASTNTNETDVDSYNFTAYNGGGQLYTKLEIDLDSPSLAWSSGVSATANTKYTIWIEIQCKSTAVVGHTPSFTFEMKVENP
jgi:hypothetical protein